MSESGSLRDQLGRVTEIVNDAVRTGDYSKLSGQINEAVRNISESFSGDAVDAEYEPYGQDRRTRDFRMSDGYRAQMERQRAQAEHAQQMRREAEARQKERKQRQAYEDTYFARPQDTVGETLMTIFGAIIAFIFLSLTLIGTWAAVDLGGGFFIFPLILAVIAAAGVWMTVRGVRASKKKQRFKSYRNLLLPKLYMDVKDLSRKTGVSTDTVAKDLQEFTDKGMIRQGHFDDDRKTFMASDEIYAQYRETKARSDELRREEKARKKAETQKKKENAKYSPEVKSILDAGGNYIQEIHAANDAIEDPVVSEKLDRMENIVRRIFEEVGKKPSLARGLGMFMDYYLPTTTKLIWAYDGLTKQPVQGENIRTAKQEIEASLDTINDAFEKLLDGFFKEQAMDVSSDINVMKMMMKQDGLTEDDLTAAAKGRKKQETARQTAGSENETAKAAESTASLKAPWDTSETSGAQQAVQTQGSVVQHAAQAQGGAQQAVQTQGGAQAQQMMKDEG